MIFLRYLIVAAFFSYFARHSAFLLKRKIINREVKKVQVIREIVYSWISSFIFGAFATWILYSFKRGQTHLYLHIHWYDFFWIPCSLFLILFMHETYYYWIHRWMHKPGVYKWIHRTHHESLVTTAWTSFSFHPLESLLQALPLFLIIYFLPLQIVTVILALIIMALTSVVNHLNSELYPESTYRSRLGSWWIGATHHSLHHSRFNYNYGLYFTFWDRWMKTEAGDFASVFTEVTHTK